MAVQGFAVKGWYAKIEEHCIFILLASRSWKGVARCSHSLNTDIEKVGRQCLELEPSGLGQPAVTCTPG